MKIKRRKKNVFAETCAPSDLAFLLIIYFLVIAGFNVNAGFLMNLPARDSTRLILSDDLLRLEMNETGALIYHDTKMNMAEAESLIRSAVAGHPDLALVLSIDPLAPWQEVVLFVELAQKLKVESFSFGMKDKP